METLIEEEITITVNMRSRRLPVSDVTYLVVQLFIINRLK